MGNRCSSSRFDPHMAGLTRTVIRRYSLSERGESRSGVGQTFDLLIFWFAIVCVFAFRNSKFAFTVYFHH